MQTSEIYLKQIKDYCKSVDLKSDDIYACFNERQSNVLKKYFEVYTKYSFNNILGNLELKVSVNKVNKLIELKGEGDWQFSGMYDAHKKGAASCELGHPLRYVYKARNKNNGNTLQFGINCASDFFDIGKEELNAMIRVKDNMVAEVVRLKAIMFMSLYKEHLMYDCGDLGKVLMVSGTSRFDKLGNSSLLPIVKDFYDNDLPLPLSLVEQIKENKLPFSNILNDITNFDVNIVGLRKLQNSEITVIAEMFYSSENDILDLIKNGKLNEKSDFFNFRNVSDLNEAIVIWIDRGNKLKDAQDYFDRNNIGNTWNKMYKLMIKKGLHREEPKFYYAVEILMLFDKDASIQKSFYLPREYGCNGHGLSEKAIINFDSLIEYMATREFFNMVKEGQDLIEEEKKEQEEKRKRIDEMIKYMNNNLEDERYASVKGIVGVKDILLNKKLNYYDMSIRQRNYVDGVYKYMQEIDDLERDKEKEKSVNQNRGLTEEANVNMRYKLSEKTDMLAKIQRLQSEVYDKLGEVEKGIIKSVMDSHWISDKQIRRLNIAFSKYINGEEVEEVEKRVTAGGSNFKNKKWNLIERPDVKEKIIQLQRHSEYTNIPTGVKNIFENILKYNSASENQIKSVENTYKRYFG